MTDEAITNLLQALKRIEERLDHLAGKVDPTQESIFMTPAETARALRVGESTLKRWRLEGGGPKYVQQGRIVRYPREAVRTYANRKIVGLS